MLKILFRANLSLLFKELSLPKLNNNRTFDINYKKIILENIISILEMIFLWKIKEAVWKTL